MSRNILNLRHKTSPNIPPRAPAKIMIKGQPIPLSMNFVIQGTNIERKDFKLNPDTSNQERKLKWTVFNNAPKPRPHSAHVDKHVLKSLSRSPSVDSSFYDKFERLDRDSVVGDVAYKEKGGNLNMKRTANTKSKSRPASARVRCKSSSGKIKRRSNSASSVTRKPHKDASTSSFFETVMSFDDETKQNTRDNAVRDISPSIFLTSRTQNKQTTQKRQKRRPKSGFISRERSPSCKRSERRNSIESRSAGSASVCSSRTSRSSKRIYKKQRPRKSRSRTRRISSTTGVPDLESSSRKSSAVRIQGEGSKTKRKNTNMERQKMVTNTINALPSNEFVSVPIKTDENFAYGYNPTGIQYARPNSSNTRTIRLNRTSPIGAVQKANKVRANGNIVLERDNSERNRKILSSGIPRLKMMVVQTPTPIPTLVRTIGTQMLMQRTNSAEKKKF